MSQLKSFHKETLFLIDGSGFIFRAYHALPPLTRKDGTPIGAVLGFTNMLVKVLTEMDAHYLGVIFDAGRHTFRNDIYGSYKANRGETPEDLIPQFPLIRDVCRAFDVPLYEREGFEADDIIATYTAEAPDRDIVILSSDKDLMQLVSDRVKLYDPIKNRLIDKEGVHEKFGVDPSNVIDVQALIGDSSDNIPGVPGIGPKTASLLIEEFGTLEGLLENAHTIPQNKRRASILEFADQARLSKALVTLKKDVEGVLPLEQLRVEKPNHEKVKRFLEAQEFYVLLKRLFPDNKSEALPPSVPSSYTLVTKQNALQSWIKKAEDKKAVAFDTETNSLDAKSAALVGISMSVKPGEACYVPVWYQPKVSLLEHRDQETILDRETVLKTLKPLLENPNIQKIGHNLKYDQLVLKKYGLHITNMEDTMLLSYLQQGGRHGLDALAEGLFEHKMISFKEVTGVGKKALSFEEVSLKEATNYAAEDADYTLRLYDLLKSQVANDETLSSIYQKIDVPLIDVLVAMEDVGIKVDPQVLNQLTHDMNGRMHQLEKEIFDLAGEEFNIASPKQLGEVLFEKMALPAGKKSKTGAYATGSDILENLALDYPIAEKVLAWRHFSKLKSTYTTALIDQINPTTGRVHTSYAMAVTSTGRLSSSDPNLQNIPIRTEEGRKIRKAFVAEEGFRLFSFDYSQIELRLLAHMADIPPLVEAFNYNKDIHQLTASQVFGVPLDQVTGDLRSKAKAINFGIIYGISAFGLAKQLKVSRKEAADYIDSYHRQYPGIKAYMDQTIAFAKDHAFVETLWGRRCFVPNIHSKNGMLRSFAERQAINAPLQGSNADFIKKAMIQIHQFLTEKKCKSRMLLQVHDELIFEIHDTEKDMLVDPIQNMMESIEKLKVPLIVGIGQGDTWEDAH